MLPPRIAYTSSRQNLDLVFDTLRFVTKVNHSALRNASTDVRYALACREFRLIRGSGWPPRNLATSDCSELSPGHALPRMVLNRRVLSSFIRVAAI